MDATEEALALSRLEDLPRIFEIQDHIESGRPQSLAAVKSSARQGDYEVPELREGIRKLSSQLTRALSHPRSMDESDRRALHVLVAVGALEEIADRWFNPALREEGEEEDLHSILGHELYEQGFDELAVASFTASHLSPLVKEEWPTSAGRYLTHLDDDSLRHAIRNIDGSQAVLRVLAFLLDHAKLRMPALVESFLESGATPEALPGICKLLIHRGGAPYERIVLDAFERLDGDWPRLQVRSVLADFRPDVYREDALRRAQAYFDDLSWTEEPDHPSIVEVFLEVASCMVRHKRREVLPDFLPFLSRPSARRVVDFCWRDRLRREMQAVLNGEESASIWAAIERARSDPSSLPAHETLKRIALNKVVKHLGRESIPAIIAGIDAGDLTTRLEGVIHLLEHENDAYSDIVHREVERGLREGGEIDTIRFLGLVRHLGVEKFRGGVIALLKHPAKPVRNEAIRALSALGESVIEDAEDLLRSDSAKHRLGAVQVLVAVRTRRALDVLEKRLPEETDERIREAIRFVLDAAERARGRKTTRPALEREVEKAEAEIDAFRVKWLTWHGMPPLHYKDGDRVSEKVVRYLLYLQSRSKNIRPEPDVEAALELIDRRRSGDAAVYLHDAYANAGCLACDRWALASIALLGDHRIVPLLIEKVERWVKKKRWKMAECAIHALCILESEEALPALHALSERYKKRFRNIGKAAARAFDEAASRLGLEPEDLGDSRVPWLGFEPGRPRILKFSGRRIEVRVGLDFRLEYHDLLRNERLSSLPPATPAAVRRQLKDAALSLQETARRQIERVETLLVTQHLWTVERWQRHYLTHPVLRPFAVRLVWGAYDAGDNLILTFRAREDEGLTDHDDCEVELPPQSFVGLVHPVDLAEETVESWKRHLAAHEIQPPFAQLER